MNDMKVRFRSVLALLVLAVVSACGKSAPDDEALLRHLGFSQPVVGVVHAAQISNSPSDWSHDPNAKIIALLVGSHIVKLSGDTSHDPWWQFYVDGGTVTGSDVTFPFGERVIEQRSNQESWTEGSTQYFAETILYSIAFDKRLSKAGLADLHGLTLRLVAMRDPAEGEWTVVTDSVRGTKYGQDDQSLVDEQLVTRGAIFLGVLAVEVSTAMNDAFRQMQSQLAAAGILERSASDHNVLVSRNNHLAYYTLATSLPQPVSYGEAEQFCTDVSANGYGHWRVPHLVEIQTIIDQNKRIIDVPDGRLWGDAMRPPPGHAIIFTTNTFVNNAGAELSLSTLDPNDSNGAFGQYLIVGNGSGMVTMGRDLISQQDARSRYINGSDPSYDYRVICVTAVP